MMGRLRCLSFNLWKNEGRFEERLAKLIDLLPRIDADVIALQECFAAPDLQIDVAASLARACGMHLTRATLREKVRLHGGREIASRSDMAILSRTAPLSSELAQLPADPRDGDRALLWISLRMCGELLHVGCTHLTHLRDDNARMVRKAQAETISKAFLDSDSATSILLGDLNARAGDTELDPLLAHRRLYPASAAVAANASCAVSPTDGALDHILLYPAPGTRWEADRQVILPPDADDPDAGPSDHPAILADLVRQ